MAYYSSRLAYELDLSRKVALERELEYSRAIQIQRIAEAKELEYKELKELDRLREEQEFRDYQIRKNAELIEAEDNLARERLYRVEKQKEYNLFVQAQRRSRILRDEELEVQHKILEQQQRRKSEALAASRRVQMERQIQVKEEVERENAYVLEEQKNQQKLQKELREIDLQIGSIYDARDQRKKQELLQLQKLDEKIFKLKQQLRGSKVRQLALEEELVHLSKLIA